MASNRQDREARRRIAQMEAKRALRTEQAKRRKRDNVFAAAGAGVVIALAVALQLTVFSSNPTPAEMELLETPLAAPATEGTNIGDIPDPSIAADRTFSGELATSEGSIGVELDGAAAPQAVAVFKTLADQGFFSGKTCHRLTTAETMGVLQCGSVDGEGGGDPEFQWGPVENAPEDGLYPAGTIAVARGQSTYSNGTQFFIAYKDTVISPQTGGYTVMGTVTSGLDVLQAIASGGVEGDNGSQDGKPRIPVTIDSLTLN